MYIQSIQPSFGKRIKLNSKKPEKLEKSELTREDKKKQDEKDEKYMKCISASSYVTSGLTISQIANTDNGLAQNMAATESGSIAATAPISAVLGNDDNSTNNKKPS